MIIFHVATTRFSTFLYACRIAKVIASLSRLRSWFYHSIVGINLIRNMLSRFMNFFHKMYRLRILARMAPTPPARWKRIAMNVTRCRNASNWYIAVIAIHRHVVLFYIIYNEFHENLVHSPTHPWFAKMFKARCKIKPFEIKNKNKNKPSPFCPL